MKTFFVYSHINKINDKIYIGITSQARVKDRWKNGKGYKNSPHFYSAIQKYGWENFEHNIIASGLSIEEAEKMERELITKYDTTNKDKGYNIQTGGLDWLYWVSSYTRSKRKNLRSKQNKGF